MRKLHIKDHIAEFMNRLQLNPVAGQTGVYDYTPVYGEIYQQGDALLAQQLNTIQTYIDEDKQEKVEAVGLLKGEGSGSVSAAVAGSDYATPAQVAGKQDAINAVGLLKGNGSAVSAAVAGTDYATPAQLDAKLDANDYAHLATPLTTGTSTAFVLTLNPPLTAYTTGMMLAVRFHTSGYTGATLNINGLGSKAIYAMGNTYLTAMSAGVHLLLYDGTYWRLMDSFLSIYGGAVSGNITPTSGNVLNLGSSTARWNTVYTNNLQINGSSMPDFVTEQGTSGIWSYRKWKSGIKECWGRPDALDLTPAGVDVSLPFTMSLNTVVIMNSNYSSGTYMSVVYSGLVKGSGNILRIWGNSMSTGGFYTGKGQPQIYLIEHQ